MLLQFHEHGYLFLSSADKVPILRKNHETQKSCGVSWMELMDVHKLKVKFPWLKTDNIEMGSFGHENEGYFDPWGLLTGLKAKAISQGVHYIDGTVVEAEVQKENGRPARINSIGYCHGSDSTMHIIPGVVVNVSNCII